MDTFRVLQIAVISYSRCSESDTKNGAGNTTRPGFMAAAFRRVVDFGIKLLREIDRCDAGAHFKKSPVKPIVLKTKKL